LLTNEISSPYPLNKGEFHLRFADSIMRLPCCHALSPSPLSRHFFDLFSAPPGRDLGVLTDASAVDGSAQQLVQQIKTFGAVNKWHIIGLVIAVVVEGLLIAWLMLLQVRRRQAEAESRRLAQIADAERKQLNDVVSNVPGIVWEAKIQPGDNGRRTTFVSNYVEKMLGITPEEWMASPAGFGLTIMPEAEDRIIANRTSEEVIASGRQGVSQFRWRAKDGRLVWAETYLNPILDDQGKTVGLRGVTIDITQRKLIEESLRETETRNRAILAAIPDLMFLQTRDGVYLDYHAIDETNLLVSPEMFLGKNMRDILPPDLARDFAECFARATEDGEPQFYEYKLSIDGTDQWFEARIVRSGDNILSVVRDITERKTSEAALQESEFNYRSIFNAANDGLMVQELATGKIIDVNERTCEMFGYTADEVKNKTVLDLSSNEGLYTQTAVTDLIQKAGAGHPQLFEWHAKKSSGELFWVEVGLRRASLSGKACLLAVVRDISERKEAEAQLAQSHRQVNEILESIGDAFYSLDNELRLTYVNRKTEELWGMKREDLLGKNFLEVFPQSVGTHSYHECMRAINEGCIVNFETISPILNRWVEVSVYPTASGLSIYFRDVTDRKRSLDELRQSEERFSKAFRANPQPMALTTMAEGRYLDVNDSLLAISGYQREELIGHTALELGVWGAPERRHDFIAQLREKGSLVNVETKFRTKNGEVRTFLSSAEQLEIDGLDCLLIASSDITERMKAQQALQESEARLSLAYQASRMGTFEWNLKTGVSTWSRELEEMYGLLPGTFASTHGAWENLVHPDDRGNAEAMIQQAMETGRHAEGEWRVRWPDGSIHWIFSRVQVFRDEAGKPKTMSGINIDITERILARQAVEESETRFRNLADTAPVMIWLVDENQGCIYVNRHFLDFTGRTLEQELGFGWNEDVHPDDLQNTMDTYTEAFQKRLPLELELRMRRADGKYRWVLTSSIPRFSSAGTFLGYIGTGVDFTERKESEEALRTAHDELQRLKNQLEAENIYLQEELQEDQSFGDIVGQSAPVKYVLYKISQVAPTDSSVLITGETGTGKELVARAIHAASRRQDRPLIRVNCAALSPTLIESELFGHEKGAFTGAAARKLGRFEVANGGTLLLDEIGELPLDLQSKLLQVLQDGEFERVGGSKTVRVDVRVIAATNRDLRQQVEKNQFREDLWYRLNVFPIMMPSLRDRRDDIPVLTDHFVRRFARKFGKPITAVSPDSMDQLCNYSWPGNVRELANVIERAVINSRGSVLRIRDDFFSSEVETLAAQVKTLEEMERDYIIRILQDMRWRIDGPNGAARVLGMNPSTLRTRMGKLGIQKPNGRSSTPAP
jgi:PAS domain S-box-containing protein